MRSVDRVISVAYVAEVSEEIPGFGEDVRKLLPGQVVAVASDRQPVSGCERLGKRLAWSLELSGESACNPLGIPGEVFVTKLYHVRACTASCGDVPAPGPRGSSSVTDRGELVSTFWFYPEPGV